MVHFGSEGRFGCILGLQVTFDQFLVSGSLWVHFGSDGHFWFRKGTPNFYTKEESLQNFRKQKIFAKEESQ